MKNMNMSVKSHNTHVMKKNPIRTSYEKHTTVGLKNAVPYMHTWEVFIKFSSLQSKVKSAKSGKSSITDK